MQFSSRPLRPPKAKPQVCQGLIATVRDMLQEAWGEEGIAPDEPLPADIIEIRCVDLDRAAQVECLCYCCGNLWISWNHVLENTP